MHLLQLETREYIFLVNWHQSIKCRSNANLFIVEFQFTISFLLTLLVLHISTVQNREMEVHCEHQMTSKYVEILVYGSPVLEVKDLKIQGILSHGMMLLLGIMITSSDRMSSEITLKGRKLRVYRFSRKLFSRLNFSFFPRLLFFVNFAIITISWFKNNLF